MEIPSLGGNWVDFVIVGILLFFFIEGLSNRLIPASINLVGFILTYTLALKFYNIPADLLIANFSLPRGIANALGFFIMAMIIETAYSMASSSIYRQIPSKLLAAPINRYLGFVPALGNGLILVAFMLTLVVTLPTAPHIKKAIVDSKIGSALVLRTQTVEQAINKVFGQAVNETLNFLTVHPNPRNQESIDLKFTTKDLTIDAASEEQMLAFVNKERTERGVKALTMDAKLRELSRSYARDMFERGYFSHYNPEGESPFDRMDKAGISYSVAGENLAYSPNVEVAHRGLMDSEGHRANILSKDFGKVGIGVIDGGIYGKMFVQEFTD